VLRRRRADAELEEEIRDHVERQAAANRLAGLTPREALRQARVTFGPVEAMKEQHREARSLRWLEDFAGDLRLALRALRRNPGLALTIVVTLAIGIGANTSIYSAVDAVIRRPLPFRNPDRLVAIGEDNRDRGWVMQTAAPANYLDWKEQARGFEGVAAWSPYVNALTLTGHGEPVVLNTYAVTGNLFELLGVGAELGRTFTDAETWAGDARVAILSDRLWRDRFQADRGVIGTIVQLDGNATTVVGVMPPTFRLPGADADLWRPMAWNPASRQQVSFRRAHYIRVVARLAPGADLAQADAGLQAVVRQLQQQYPETNATMGASLRPLQDFLIGNARTPLLALLGAVGILLLIACANVGNLLLARMAGRSRESALRLALGARRGRLIRHALTESLLLSGLGGMAGLLLGWLGTRLLVALQPAGLLPADSITVTGRVLPFVLLISILSGALFSITPLLWNRRRLPHELLREDRRVGAGQGARRSGNALAIVELALAALLTLGAGLLVRSYGELLKVDPGFDPNRVLSLTLNISAARYDTPEKVTAFYDDLEQRVAALPGVVSQGSVSSLPLSGGVGWTSEFTIAGAPDAPEGAEIAHRTVSPGYYRTMGTPLIAGRMFTVSDRDGTEPVALVNQAMARRFFGDQDPVGQRISFDRPVDSTSSWYTIVGVVGDQHQVDLATPAMAEVLVPAAQDARNFRNILIRTSGDPMSLVAPVRRIIAGMDPALALTSTTSMEAMRDDALARGRFLMLLFGLFALAGGMLAAVSVYGVMANLTRTRLREMGVRLALGASPAAIRRMVLRAGLRLALMGIGLGVVAALLATRALSSLLFGVRPVDPLSFTVAPLLLAGAALLATWLPAAMASRVDPAVTLRAE
jgi:putative ABC transport system permease protein